VAGAPTNPRPPVAAADRHSAADRHHAAPPPGPPRAGAVTARRSPARHGIRAVLANGCWPGASVDELVRAASAARYGAVTLWGSTLARALADGASEAGLADQLYAHGMSVSEIETCDDWARPGEPSPGLRRGRLGQDRLFGLACALGVGTVTAAVPGAGPPAPDAAHRFGLLCDRAAAAGLRVALEIGGGSVLRTVADAWALVGECGRVNAGLAVDLWQHARSGADDGDLYAIPPGRIFSVRLADGRTTTGAPGLPERCGAAVPGVPGVPGGCPGSPAEAAAGAGAAARLVPGTGTLPLARYLALLRTMGVAAPVVVDVWQPSWPAVGLDRIAEQLGEGLVRVLDAMPAPAAAPARQRRSPR
jgi:sugar phosphate isomerase/epimerase